ncbi:Y-family DNA polymerase [Marinobacterium arenosum]|uniref:Y-family DNA polymerase n=1 Tax=Marinobacterium arenosum TaxID=2862496 RepID=UPI001C9624EA|nr:DNA polymerase Y family protein [Marinobacterium arenosum]MBY4675911.1 DNA polymerase Y family protein [Marinobacterium arenosum]
MTASRASTGREPLWLYLHFPLLALECQLNLSGVAAPGAAALLDDAGRQLRLCNGDAVRAGVEQGMAPATAYSICPELQLLKPNPEQARYQLESLAFWAGNFSAQISLYPPDGLLLEIASMLHYFGGLESFRQRLEQQQLRLGYGACRATGHTPQAARLLARAGRQLCLADKHAHLQQLQELPVNQLELPARMAEQLNGMGLQRLAQLLQLPRESLSNRFGPHLLDHLDRLVGRTPDPQSPFLPPPQFVRLLEFSRELESSQALLFPLRPILESLQGYLRLRGLQAEQLQLLLVARDGEQQLLEICHAGGASEAGIWLELCRLRFEQLRLQQPVLAMQLLVEQFRELDAETVDLFSPPQGRERPAQLLSRLRVRLGEQAVQPLALYPDHRPEKGWTTQGTANLEVVAVPKGRPAWLLRQPERLAQAQLERQVELLKGPERISGGWWDGLPVRRDYYIGRWSDGRLGWLFRDDCGDWYLHGWYG